MSSPGDVVDGRFRLIERIGGGGMGTVWRARDTVLERDVALKAVRQDAEVSATTRERVLREARALARLSSPHVVTVHHVVEAEPHPWIVMELVSGESLEHRLSQGLLSPVEAAGVGRQVLAALRAAHAAGILHRDVKPANIVLRPGDDVVLVDFGIAALQDLPADRPVLTASGQLVGSPEYMAPERIRGDDDDPASDLWSLGLVLYTAVTGVRPFRRPSAPAVLAAVLEAPLPALEETGPLAPVLRALLVRDPAARPDAARLDSMLAQVGAGTPDLPTVTAERIPRPRPTTGQGSDTPPVGPTPTRSVGPGPVLYPPEPPGGESQRPEAPRRGSRPAVVVTAALGAAALATAVVLLVSHLGDPGDTGGTSGGRPGTVPVSVTARTSTPVTVPTPAAPTTSLSPSVVASPNLSPSHDGSGGPSSSRRPSPSAPPAGQGRWIAQLFSEPVSSGTATRDRRLAAVRASAPEARYLLSSDYASLRGGYWVIYAPGPFADGTAALAYCADRGLTTSNSCIGRFLSDDPGDFGLQCHPPASHPTGRCTKGT